MKKWPLILAALAMLALLVAVVYFFLFSRSTPRAARVMNWIRDPDAHPDWAVQANELCAGALFQLPTSGYIGFLWDDSFRLGHRHSGIDIFGGGQPGETPVYAVYDGYLTRLEDWKSTVIIRHPQDPLQPERQIWTYYTHLADPQGNPLIDAAFPPGTSEVFVKAGTLLGTQGNYSGTAGNPTGVHLHFSIVMDNGQGSFLNELEIENTLDPSPYFNLPLNARSAGDEVILCPSGG